MDGLGEDIKIVSCWIRHEFIHRGSLCEDGSRAEAGGVSEA
jgi:hypothetical protein